MPGLPRLNDHFKIGREYKLMRNPRKMASKWFKKQSPRGLLSVAAWDDEMPASLRVVKQLVPLVPVQVQDASSASLGAAIPENEASLEGHVCARLWPESEMQEKLRGAGFYHQYVQPDGHCGVSSFLMANGHANTPENVAKLRKDVVAFANALPTPMLELLAGPVISMEGLALWSKRMLHGVAKAKWVGWEFLKLAACVFKTQLRVITRPYSSQMVCGILTWDLSSNQTMHGDIDAVQLASLKLQGFTTLSYNGNHYGAVLLPKPLSREIQAAKLEPVLISTSRVFAASMSVDVPVSGTSVPATSPVDVVLTDTTTVCLRRKKANRRAAARRKQRKERLLEDERRVQTYEAKLLRAAQEATRVAGKCEKGARKLNAGCIASSLLRAKADKEARKSSFFRHHDAWMYVAQAEEQALAKREIYTEFIYQARVKREQQKRRRKQVEENDRLRVIAQAQAQSDLCAAKKRKRLQILERAEDKRYLRERRVEFEALQLKKTLTVDLLLRERARSALAEQCAMSKLRVVGTLRTLSRPDAHQNSFLNACKRAIKDVNATSKDKSCLEEAFQEYSIFAQASCEHGLHLLGNDNVSVRRDCKVVIARAHPENASEAFLHHPVSALVKRMEWYLQSTMQGAQSFKPFSSDRQLEVAQLSVICNESRVGHKVDYLTSEIACLEEPGDIGSMLIGGLGKLYQYFQSLQHMQQRNIQLLLMGSLCHARWDVIQKCYALCTSAPLSSQPAQWIRYCDDLLSIGIKDEAFRTMFSFLKARSWPSASTISVNISLLRGCGRKGSASSAHVISQTAAPAPLATTTLRAAKPAALAVETAPSSTSEKNRAETRSRSKALASRQTPTPERVDTPSELLETSSKMAKPVQKRHARAASASASSSEIEEGPVFAEDGEDSGPDSSPLQKVQHSPKHKRSSAKSVHARRVPETERRSYKPSSDTTKKGAHKPCKDRSLVRKSSHTRKGVSTQRASVDHRSRTRVRSRRAHSSSDYSEESDTSSQSSSSSTSSSDMRERVTSTSTDSSSDDAPRRRKRAKRDSSVESDPKSRKRTRPNRGAPTSRTSNLRDMFQVLSAHAKGDKLSTYLWTEAKYAGCKTPASLHAAKSDHIRDLISMVPSFTQADDKTKINMFLSILQGTDRVLIDNYAHTNKHATWIMVRDKWIFPTGKTASVSDLRTESTRKQRPDETATEYLAALYNARRRLFEVDADEKQKSKQTRGNELYESVKEGLCWAPVGKIERKVTAGLYSWLLKRGLKASRSKPTYEIMVEKSNRFAHEAAEIERVSATSDIHQPLNTPAKLAPTYKATRSTIESATGQLPDQETQSETVVKRWNTERVFTDKPSDKKIVSLSKVDPKRAKRTRKRSPSLSDSSSSSSESEETQPVKRKVQIRKRSRADKAPADKFQMQTNTQIAAQRDQTRSDVSSSQRDISATFKKAFCRHCGKVLQAHETFATHDCTQKQNKVFYCNGCRGPMPGVSNLSSYYQHLHMCPSVMCKACNVNTHAYFTCPKVQCTSCNGYGHYKWVHNFAEGATGSKVLKALLISTAAPIPTPYKRKVTFLNRTSRAAAADTSSDDDDSKSLLQGKGVDVYSACTDNTSDLDGAPCLLKGTGDRLPHTSSSTPRYLRHRRQVDNPPHVYYDPTLSPRSMENTDTDNEDNVLYATDSSEGDKDKDFNEMDYYPKPTDAYEMFNDVCKNPPVSPMSRDLREKLNLRETPYPSLVTTPPRAQRRTKRKRSTSAFNSQSRSSSSTSSGETLLDDISICCDELAPYFQPDESVKSIMETCFQVETLLILIISSTDRLTFERLRRVNRRMRLLHDSYLAKLVRAAKSECGRLWDLSIINYPRHLPQFQKLTARHLCYACSIVNTNRCVRHSTCVSTYSEELRFKFVVQKHALPAKNDVEALYREFDTMLLWGTRSSTETKRLRKVIAHMLCVYDNLGGPDILTHRFRSRQLLQGLTWDYYEVNVIAKNTMRPFGGIRSGFHTVSSKLSSTNGEDIYKRTYTGHGEVEIPFVALEYHRINTFHNLQYDLIREHVAAAYNRIKQELESTIQFRLKETYLPPDLHRELPEGGMFSTWVMYQAIRNFKENPTDLVRSYLLMRNQVWSDDMVTRQNVVSQEICEHLKWKIHIPNEYVPVDGFRQNAASPPLQDFVNSPDLRELSQISTSDADFNRQVLEFQHKYNGRKSQRETTWSAHNVIRTNTLRQLSRPTLPALGNVEAILQGASEQEEKQTAIAIQVTTCLDDEPMLLKGTGERNQPSSPYRAPISDHPWEDPTFSPDSEDSENLVHDDTASDTSEDETKERFEEDFENLDQFSGNTDAYLAANAIGELECPEEMSGHLREELFLIRGVHQHLTSRRKTTRRSKKQRVDSIASSSSSTSSSSSNTSANEEFEKDLSMCINVWAPYFQPDPNHKSTLELCMEAEFSMISILSSLNRLNFEDLRHLNRRMRYLLDGHIAKLVRTARPLCGRVWDLSPINFPRNLSAVRNMTPPYLCYACAVAHISRCVRHSTKVRPQSEELHFKFIIQKSAIPVRNNVEAFYRELDTILLWGAKSTDETKRLRKVIGAKVLAYATGPHKPDLYLAKCQLRELSQGLTWDYYELNTLSSNTLRPFGGKSLQFSSTEYLQANTEDFYNEHGHTDEGFALGVLPVEIEYHRVFAIETMDYLELKRNVAAAYKKVKERLKTGCGVYLKENFAPPDLYRSSPEDGMFSTWVMYQSIVRSENSPATRVRPYLLLRNQVWSHEMATQEHVDRQLIRRHLKWQPTNSGTYVPRDGYRQQAVIWAIQQYVLSPIMQMLPFVERSNLEKFEYEVSTFQNGFNFRKEQRSAMQRPLEVPQPVPAQAQPVRPFEEGDYIPEHLRTPDLYAASVATNTAVTLPYMDSSLQNVVGYSSLLRLPPLQVEINMQRAREDQFQQREQEERQMLETVLPITNSEEKTEQDISEEVNLLQGTGKRKNTEIEPTKRKPSPSTAARPTRRSIVWFTILIEGWESTLVWLMRKTFDIGRVDKHRVLFMHEDEKTTDLEISLQDLAAELQTYHATNVETGHACARCSIYPWSPYFDNNKCTFCNIGYMILNATLEKNDVLSLTDTCNKKHLLNLKDVEMEMCAPSTLTVSPMYKGVLKAELNKAMRRITQTKEASQTSLAARRKKGVALLMGLMAAPTQFVNLRCAPNEGLQNLCQTICWANAILQILATCINLPDAISEANTDQNADLRVLQELLQLLGGHVPIDTSRAEVDRQVQERKTYLQQTMLHPKGMNSPGRQQDADEGYRSIVNFLSIHAVDAYKLFVGSEKVLSKCLTCNHEFTTFCEHTPPFVPVKQQSSPFDFREKLFNLTREVEKPAKNECFHCKRETSRMVKTQIIRFPKYCLLHLQRGRMNNVKVTTPLINAYDDFVIDNTVFRLLGFIAHLGEEANSGHFVAYTRASKREVHEYNDHQVSREKLADVDTATIATLLYETHVPSSTPAPTISIKEIPPLPLTISHRDGTRGVQRQTTGSNIVCDKSTGANLTAGTCSTASTTSSVVQPANNLSAIQEGEPVVQQGHTWAQQIEAKDIANLQEMRQQASTLTAGIEARMNSSSNCERHVCEHFTNEDSKTPQFVENKNAEPFPEHSEMLNWNVRSLNNVMTKATICPWEVKNFDVLVLTETQSGLTKLSKHKAFTKVFRNFAYAFWSTCTLQVNGIVNMGQAGVGVVCKKRPKSIQWGFPTETAESNAGRVLVVRWTNSTLIAVYAPANLKDGTESVRDFFKQLQILVCKERAIQYTLVVGDLNIPLTSIDFSTKQLWLKGDSRVYVTDQEVFRNFLTNCELRDASASLAGTFTWFPEPTQIMQANKVGMRLDYVLLPISSRVICCAVLENLAVSDHRPILVEFHMQGDAIATLKNYATLLTETENDCEGTREQDILYNSVLHEIVDRLHAQENGDFRRSAADSAIALHTRDLEAVHGTAQPAFRSVVLAPDIVEAALGAETEKLYEQVERDMVISAMRAYCQLRETRKEIPPPRVALHILGATSIHYALVDTGATLCLCDAQLIYKLMKESPALQQSEMVALKNFKLQLGDGDTYMSVVAKIRISFYLKSSEGKDVTIQQWFYMTSRLPDCWVIGDSLFHDQKAHKADISQHHRTLSFNGHIVPYVKMEPHFHCHMKGAEVIPAGSTITCSLSAAGNYAKVRYEGVLSDRLENPHLSIVVDAIRIWENNHIRVKIYNKSKHTLNLNDKQSVACFQVTKHLCDLSDERLRVLSAQDEDEGDDLFKMFDRRAEPEISTPSAPPKLAEFKQKEKISDFNDSNVLDCTEKAIQSDATMGHDTYTKHTESRTSIEGTALIRTPPPEKDASDPVKILRSTVDDANNVANDMVLSVRGRIEFFTPPPSTDDELQVEIGTLLGPEVVLADTAAALREIPAPAHVDDIADDNALRPVLRLAVDLLRGEVGLATILLSSDWKAELPKSVLDEALPLLCALRPEEVPDYFDGDALSDKYLPAYLHGWKVNVNDLSISKQSFNLFIFECLVLPEGREDLFRETEPGRVHNYEAVIDLQDKSTWIARLRPGHNTDKTDFKTVLDRYLAQGLIRKVDNATCTSLAMMVSKKGGRNQLAFDYRDLNKHTQPCLWPLPLLGDCLDSLGLARFLTSIDINGAYHSIPVALESQEWLTFLCHYGLYTWTRLPYGYKNSGPIFCNVVFETLLGLVYEILTLYVDDIKVFGGITERAHTKCITLVLNRLQKRGFRVSVKKCHFFVKEMDHLGINCYGDGTRPTRSNVTKITNICVENVRDVRGFLASTNYYRRFIKSYAQIVSPLLVYLRKDAKLPQVLPDEIVSAIARIKEVLTTYPILRNPDFTKQFILECDASMQGFGAVLKQLVDGVEIVCAYASSHISSGMLKYTPDMLELIGAVWSMEHFSHYLRRRKFILKTDNVILKWLRGKSLTTTKTAFIKWVLMAQAYDFDIVHVPGPRLVMGDLLSRAGARHASVDKKLEEMEDAEYSSYITASTSAHFVTAEISGACYYKQGELRAGVEQANKEDEKSARVVKNKVIYEDLSRQRWILEQKVDNRLSRALESENAHLFVNVSGLWFKKGKHNLLRVVVPDSLRATLMTIAHTFLGHRGVKPIVRYVSRKLYWPGIWVYARAWVLSCSDCRRRKMPRKMQAWLGHVRQVEIPWYCLSMDFILQFLPKTAEGYIYCLTVMCVFTRYPIAIPLKTKEPRELAMALFKEVFSIFGFPVVVLSDNDSTLVNEAMTHVFKRFGIRRTLTLWRRPQSNGHLERFHRYVNETMSIILARYPEWVDMLPVMLFAFRCMAQETVGFSPHYLNFGRDAMMPLDVSWCTGSDDKILKPQAEGSAPESFANSLIARLQAAFKFVRCAQIKASDANKARVLRGLSNRTNVQPVRFESGDLVYLREDTSVFGKDGAMRVTIPDPKQFVPRKWCFKWTGPHLIVKALGERAYILLHTQRKKELKVSMDDLRIHVPFSKDLFDTARSAPTVRQRDLPPPEGCNAVFRDEEGNEYPSIGDYVITRRPDFEEQEFCVLRKVNATQYHWHSSQNMNRLLKKDLNSFTTLAHTRWYPGWWIESQMRVTYEYEQPPNSVAYLADDNELPHGFLVWGFTLNKSCRVSQQLCTWVEAYCDPANNTSLPM